LKVLPAELTIHNLSITYVCVSVVIAGNIAGVYFKLGCS